MTPAVSACPFGGNCEVLVARCLDCGTRTAVAYQQVRDFERAHVGHAVIVAHNPVTP